MFPSVWLYLQYRENWPGAMGDWRVVARIEVNNVDDMRDNRAVITGLILDVSYNIRVLAENSYGESTPSNTITRTIKCESRRLNTFMQCVKDSPLPPSS